MLYFESDYNNGAHEAVLEHLIKTNNEKLPGYGSDYYCEKAAKKILEACGCPNGEVYFLVGGTQTNTTVIKSYLAPFEGVISATTGHVAVHEGGAIENTGHKVLTVEEKEGKIMPETLKNYLETFWNDGNHDHMVFPGMVYISHPTEYGTLYTKAELEVIYGLCRQYDIPLFVDGARLGYGLMSRETDVSLQDLAALCDVFYIGGTKVGALCGEAVVFTKNSGKGAPRQFVTMVKQQGALLAKGRVLGVQFDALFTDDLYCKISKNAIDTAELLKEGLTKKGYPFFLKSPTNQQFIILENEEMERLKEKVVFSFWEKYDDTHTVIRFATSWATKPEDVETLLSLLEDKA